MATADVLVVGATGMLGAEIVRLLEGAGRSVRALVRAGTDARKRTALRARKVEVVEGDLKDQGSLKRACDGVTAVVSTASATLSRQTGDSIQTVDTDGQLSLVDSAERMGVNHFVYISLPPNDIDFALIRGKRLVEARLRESTMSFTVLRPSHFMELWLGPALGFDPLAGAARIFGDGTRPVSWASLLDVARFAAAACGDPRFAGKVLPLGGSEAWTPLDVIDMFHGLGAPRCALEHVPESTLDSQRAAASSALEEAFAALMLTQARGQVVDSKAALELLPAPLRTVGEYAVDLMKAQTLNP